MAQDFIRSISGLQYLNLCYVPAFEDYSFFDVKCLENHKHTLKDLYFGIGANNLGYHSLQRLSIDEFQWMCSSLTHLRQLAIPLPQVRLDDVFTAQWHGYDSAIVSLRSQTLL